MSQNNAATVTYSLTFAHYHKSDDNRARIELKLKLRAFNHKHYDFQIQTNCSGNEEVNYRKLLCRKRDDSFFDQNYVSQKWFMKNFVVIMISNLWNLILKTDGSKIEIQRLNLKFSINFWLNILPKKNRFEIFKSIKSKSFLLPSSYIPKKLSSLPSPAKYSTRDGKCKHNVFF